MAVSTETLEIVIKALGAYVDEVKVNIAKMTDAANDCHDNMERDDYSLKAIENLEDSIAEIKKAIGEADDLRCSLIELHKRIVASTE